MKKLFFLMFSCCMLGTLPLGAQDVHYSQFNNSFHTMNPALTSVFDGDVRFAANYKNQWSSVPVDYNSFTLSADKKFYRGFLDSPNFFGAGIFMEYDRAGDSDLALFHLGLTGSYTMSLNENNFLTGGLGIGYVNRRFDDASLRWGSQYDPSVGWVNSNPGETLLNQSVGFLDLSAGVNYRYQTNWRNKLDLGVGLFHLNQPNTGFDEAEYILPVRMSIIGEAQFKLSSALDLEIAAMFNQQKEYSEFLINPNVLIYLDNDYDTRKILHLGIGMRTGDAIYPVIGFTYHRFFAGFNYDINTSGFEKATGSRGGPELALRYTLKKVRPINVRKVCPVY